MSDINHTQEVVDKTLAHFGVLGMKWGVRRARGPDGLVGKKAKKEYSEDYLKSRESKKKGYKSLSNKELKDLTNRMQLEKSLRELTSSDQQKGLDMVKTLTAAGTTVASLYALSQTPIGQAVKTAMRRKLSGQTRIPGF